jgi:phage gpG-like protein
MVDKNKGIVVDPGDRFKKALIKAGKKTDDLTEPLKLIAQSWYKVNKAIFILKTKGPFKELSTNPFRAYWLTKREKSTWKKRPPSDNYFPGGYRQYKEMKYGFVYPILKASGDLEKSLTNPTDSNTIASILNKKVLLLGTKVTSRKGAPYPTYLQTGTRKMPARPFMVIGTEQGAWAKSSHIQRRLKFWIETLNTYVKRSLDKKG